MPQLVKGNVRDSRDLDGASEGILDIADVLARSFWRRKNPFARSRVAQRVQHLAQDRIQIYDAALPGLRLRLAHRQDAVFEIQVVPTQTANLAPAEPGVYGHQEDGLKMRSRHSNSGLSQAFNSFSSSS